jgi:hypothetical protein
MRKLAALLAIALFWAMPAHAQEQTGSIQGTIKDASGAVLPGVTVEARSPALVGVSTAVTDAQGVYRFPALPPGVYSVVAKLSGFTDKKQDAVTLALGQTLKIDLALSIGGVSEAVNVTAEAPLIDVKSSAQTATITKETIDRIPKGRDFTNLVASNAPGADNEAKSGGIQIDGASGSENRYIVDGMDTTDLTDNTSNKTIFTDFLQEVQVKSAGYSAEYGGATGGVISAVTKSGSNQFHGSAGSYFTNNSWNGTDRAAWRINPNDNVTPEFLVTPSNPSQGWNPIGDIGGPVLHDKVWFYFGTSYDRTNTQTTATFKNSSTNPAITPYFRGKFSSYSQNTYYQWKGTSQVSKNMRLTVSGNNQRGQNRGARPSLQPNGSTFADGTPTNGFTNASWPTTNGVFDQQIFNDTYKNTGSNSENDLYSANLDWVLTPKFFANVQSGFFTYNNYTPPAFAGNSIIHSFGTSNIGLAGVPANLQFPNGYQDVTKSSSLNKINQFGRAYVNANTSYFASWKGDHQFKFGLRFERDSNDVDTGQQQPTISLRWNQADSTRDGRIVRGTFGYYTVTRNVVTTGAVHSNNWAFWAQDSWAMGKKLTVNAGVRTENEHVPSYRSEDPGISFGFGDKIAPRVGFAYDVKGDSKWKTYGSYGKYFDITPLELPSGSFGAQHWLIYYYTLDTFDWPSINCQEGGNCPGNLIEVVDNRHPANAIDPTLTAYFGQPRNTIDPTIKPVQTGELIFGTDHELGSKTSVGVRYTHKWLDRTIEDSGVLIGGAEVFFIANPGFGVTHQILAPPAPPLPSALRHYDAVETRFNKRLANRWSMTTSYTWSRIFGNYGGLASSDENGRTSPNVDRYFDGEYLLYDSKGQPVYGLLPTDRTHYLKVEGTYDLPWGTSVGVFQVLASGTPMSTEINWNGFGGNNQGGVFVNGRGDLGRTPVYSQTDLYLQHDLRVPMTKNQRANISLNVSNLFDQATVLDENHAPYRDKFVVPGVSTVGSSTQLAPADAYFFAGFNVAQLAAQMRAAGATQRDNPLFLKPTSFQGRRALRLSVKWTF